MYLIKFFLVADTVRGRLPSPPLHAWRYSSQMDPAAQYHLNTDVIAAASSARPAQPLTI